MKGAIRDVLISLLVAIFAAIVAAFTFGYASTVFLATFVALLLLAAMRESVR